MAERYAEVVADAGIDANVAQETWDAVVAELIAHAPRRNARRRLRRGDRDGRRAAGRAFPGGRGDVNELDDHLVEI